MKTIDTALTFDKSDVASFRLHLLNTFNQHGMKAVLTAYPNVSKRSIYRWQRKYLDSGKRLTSLIPKSTKPERVRQMRVPAEVLGFIKAMRQKYPRMSKYKLKPFLDEFCKDKDLPCYSVSWIGKVINRYQFFFNTRKVVRRKRRRDKGIKRIKYCPRATKVLLGYLQLDGVTVYFEGVTYRFITVIELKTRTAFVKQVPTFATKHTKALLNQIISQISYPIHTIQTDNGSEFYGEFKKAVDEFKLTHLRSYPKRPQTQGYVERFNWTLQDEFINYEIDTALVDQDSFNLKLNQWLIYYNTKRPHQGLNYKTPLQELQYQLQLRKDTLCAKSV